MGSTRGLLAATLRAAGRTFRLSAQTTLRTAKRLQVNTMSAFVENKIMIHAAISKPTRLLIYSGVIATLLVPEQAPGQSIHTPKSGSPERQAICDGARSYVMSKYASKPLPQPIVFKIDHLAVAGAYANMEVIPLFNDGRYVAPQYLPDVAFNFCLRKEGASWRVILDLSRSDVPEAAEVESIKRQLPAGFPLSLLSPTWRRLLAN